MKKLIYSLIITTALLSSCSTGVNQKEEALKALNTNNLTLTDELVVKYIAAYKALKDQGPSLLDKINKNGENPEANKTEFGTIEKAIKDNGFTGYPEFVKTNAKVAWAFSLQQAGSFMDDMSGMKDDGIKQIDEQLKNPDVPKEVKEQLEKAKQEIIAAHAKNTKWANVSLDIVNHLVNEEDKAVIKRHEKELLEAFAGASIPEMPESMK